MIASTLKFSFYYIVLPLLVSISLRTDFIYGLVFMLACYHILECIADFFIKKMKKF